MKALLKLLMVCSFALMKAHTVWIETESVAKPNQKHEIKIFFGELDEPTPTAKWFSDIKDLELRITSPSGKELIIKEKKQNENYYSSFFVPSEKGTYKISVKHLVKDTHRKMKITYHTVAFVNTDATKAEVKLGQAPLEFQLGNYVPKLNSEYAITLLTAGQTKEKDKLKVVADNSWERNLSSDENGKVVFRPIWKGKYLLEYVKSEKTEGQHNGKPYNIDYEMLTYLIDVK